MTSQAPFMLSKSKVRQRLDDSSEQTVFPLERTTTSRSAIIQNAVIPCVSREEFAREIGKLWSEAQAKFLAIGRYLVAAKRFLDEQGKHGDYERMIREDLPFGRQIAHQLRVVAEAVDSGRLQEDELPPSYSTVFLLASLDDHHLKLARSKDLVRPETTRAQVAAFRRSLVLVDPVKLQRNRERLVEEIERREAELKALRARLAEVDQAIGTINGEATEIAED